MDGVSDSGNLTSALEDYLETLWEILQTRKVAQVSEVAERRNVNVASVTPAMKRLKKMGLVDYVARAYVDLTPSGIEVARRIKSRHDLIRRFLVEVLGVSDVNAAADACAAEHMFSDETIDRLVRFFEYVQRCDQTESMFIKRFLGCSMVHPGQKKHICSCTEEDRDKKHDLLLSTRYLSRLAISEKATIVQVVAESEMRHALIDKGMISGLEIVVSRVDSDGGIIWVKVGTDQISLSLREAASILVTA